MMGTQFVPYGGVLKMSTPSSTDLEMTDSSAAAEAPHVGRVFAVPDKWWGFEALGREDHPGACVREREVSKDCDLLKGTGAENRRRYYKTEMLVVATDSNGLSKNTLFSLKPMPFRRHRVNNLVPDRVMGYLSDEELSKLRAEMLRQFGNQG